MSLRQPQACLRVPRRPFVLLFTPLSLLNAGECRRGGPQEGVETQAASPVCSDLSFAVREPWQWSGTMLARMVIFR